MNKENYINEHYINGADVCGVFDEYDMNEIGDKFFFQNHKIAIIFDDENNPWFSAKDVAGVLGYSNPQKAVRDHVNEKYRKSVQDIGVNESFTPLNYQPHSVLIKEPGLYSLIMRSKLPIAEKFQDWVFEEVLPSIRKYGEYKRIQQNNKLLESLKKSLETNQLLSLRNNQLEAIKTDIENNNKILSRTITEQTPKVAVFPNNNGLKHVFCVLIKNDLFENYGVCEYKCIRTEKRYFLTALIKAEKEGFEMCLFRENVPNGVNILNRAKEVMKYYGMYYDCTHNNVLTKYNFLNVIEQVLDHN